MRFKLSKPNSVTKVDCRSFLSMAVPVILASLVCVAMFHQYCAGEAGEGSRGGPERSVSSSYRITAKDSVISFPFDLHGGDIRYDARINGHDVRLLLDDGFMWDELLFWGSPSIDSLEMTYVGEVGVRGPGKDDAADVPARTASGVALSLPGVEFADLNAVITAYSSNVATMLSGSEGQVSATFFKNFVVDINFDKMMITLIEPGKFNYAGKGREIPWTPLGFGPWSIPGLVELEDGKILSLNFLMDMGYPNQLKLAPGGANDVEVPARSLSVNLGRNIQGVEIPGYVGRVKQVSIGGYKVPDVLCEFISEDHVTRFDPEVMIGLGLLSHFNLVYDYSRQRIFVEPNDSFDAPFEYGMSGLVLMGGTPLLDVSSVRPNSPASDAGIQGGDRILTINKRPTAEYSRDDLQALMRQEGTTLVMNILRGEESFETELILRRII